MMKFDVTLYRVVRVKVGGVTADNHNAAIREAEAIFHPQAEKLLNRHLHTPAGEKLAQGEVTGIEDAEETVRYLVDETGDEEYAKTRLYDANLQLIDGDYKPLNEPLEYTVSCHSSEGVRSAPSTVRFAIDLSTAKAVIEASEFLYELDPENVVGGQVQLPTGGRVTWMESEAREYQSEFLGRQHIKVRRRFFSVETEIRGLPGLVTTNPLHVTDLARHFGLPFTSAIADEAV